MENKKGEKVPQVVPNTAYTAWVSQDQQVLGFLLSSLSREVLTQVAALTTTADVWAALSTMHSSQSRAQIMHLRMQLATTAKRDLRVAD
jgi:hypothetical protein